VSAGRRTVAMDFLGFGASDKPEDALYSFEQQLGDLSFASTRYPGGI
jgi:haloalkane dehalogenase